MILRIEIEIDEAAATAYNASVFDGEEYGDPVVGDGRALVADVYRDSPGDLVGGLFASEAEPPVILGIRATLDGAVIA